MKGILLNEVPVNEELPVGRSKFFGVPDVWDGFEWPTGKGRYDDNEYYLDFLCQINCAEAANYDTDGVLPKNGIIYFFYNSEYRPTNDDATVFYYDGDISELKPFVFEDEESEDDESGEEGEESEVDENVEDGKESKVDETGEEGEDDEDCLDLCSLEYAIAFGEENSREKPSEYCGTHTLLGCPSDPEQMGLGSEIPEGWQMLIEIDSWVGEDIDFNFGGDCGMLCFFIDKKDLAQKDFSSIWLMASVY